MKTLQTIIAASLIALTSANVYAWGEREQGVLQGLAGAWILGRMLQQPDPQPVPPPPVYYTPPSVYVPPSPPPTVYYHRPQCYHVPYYDQFGRVAYYRQICR